jgi:pimeloyl-ACP methyl ester carboxylesterase
MNSGSGVNTKDAQQADAELSSYFEGFFEAMGLPGLGEEIEEDWLENDGLRLHLDLFLSKPSDPALVFFPGTSLYALVYAEFMHKMRLQGFNVVGIDPRGHGRSEGRRGSYTIDGLVSDARAATGYCIDRFGERVAIAGSSQGGIVSFYSAASDERLRAAVCHNIAVLDDIDSMRLTRSPRFSRFAMRLLPLARLFGEMKIPISSYLDLKAEVTKLGGRGDELIKRDPLAIPSITLGALASLASTPPPHPPDKIQVPVMVVHSELDNIFPLDYVKEIYDRLTCEKEFLLLKDRPHLVMTDYVDDIVPSVTKWLNCYLK